MGQVLPDLLLEELREFVVLHLGLHFPPERTGDLQRGMESAAREFGFGNVAECVTWLLSSQVTRKQIETLASYLTVGETYFLRDKKAFAALEEKVLPELIAERRGGVQRLRLWSAACCSGEEAYSLAITLHKLLPDIQSWQISILGTDINPQFLHKAARGIFSEWSFRDTPPSFRAHYFSQTSDKRWEVRPEIRRLVHFSHLNLIEDVYPSLQSNTNAMDLILCRNVLIYFTVERGLQVVRKLTSCLTERAWLVLGASELSQAGASDLVARRFEGAVLHQKKSSARPGSAPSFAHESTAVPMEHEPPEKISSAPTPPWENATFLPPAADAEKNYDRAHALYEGGHYAESVVQLTADPDQLNEARALSLLARALANQGRLTEAVACCDRMIAENKLNAGSHYLRASLLQEMGDPEAAELAFKRALYLEQDFVLAHFALGNLARSRGLAAVAERHFSNALTLAERIPAEATLPESEGLTAGRLREIIASLGKAESVA